MDYIPKNIFDDNFEYSNAALTFSSQILTHELKKGETAQGSFDVSASDGSFIEGFVYSDFPRIHFENTQFHGTECTLTYSVNSMGLSDSDLVSGNVFVVCNLGEYQLPYSISVTQTILKTAMGDLRNLFHFTNIAKTDWNQAVKIFYSSSFLNIFWGHDGALIPTYLGFCRDEFNEYNMDEFLISAHKKNRCQISADALELIFYQPLQTLPVTISLIGWGAVDIDILITGDFIQVSADHITAKDFENGEYILSVTALSAMRPFGEHFGKITLAANGFERPIEIPVRLSIKHRNSRVMASVERKRFIYDITGSYIDYKLSKIGQDKWLDDTQGIVDAILARDQSDILAKLFLVQLLITKNKTQDASILLKKVETYLSMNTDEPFPIEWDCYLDYLKTLITDNDKLHKNTLAKIRKLYASNTDNWRLAWFLLYLDERLLNDMKLRYDFIKRQCENASPGVLLAESLRIVSEEPELMDTLSSFELRLINFAKVEKKLSKTFIAHISTLSPDADATPALLYDVLESCIGIAPSLSLLSTMAELVMGKLPHLPDKNKFYWLGSAIEAGIFIPGIYEAFMEVMDENYSNPLPFAAAAYFAENNNLEDHNKAKLYKNILSHPDAFKSVFKTIYTQAQVFSIVALSSRQISKTMAYLYKKLLKKELLAENSATDLSGILFACEVVSDNPRHTSVAVIHDKVKGEMRYPLIDGKAIIYCYSRYHTIFFTDDRQNRTLCDEALCLTPLFNINAMRRLLAGFDIRNFRYDIYLSELNGDYIFADAESIESVKRLVMSKEIRSKCRQEALAAVINYFRDNELFTELDRCLDATQPADLPSDLSVSVLDMLAERGMYEKGLAWIRINGTHQVAPWAIFRIVKAKIEALPGDGDPLLLALCYRLFTQGKSDESMLSYLAANYDGSLKGMTDILEKAGELGLPCGILCRRIMKRVVFCGADTTEKMRLYLLGSNPAQTDRLSLAFIVYWSYDYVCRNGSFSYGMAAQLAKLPLEDIEIPAICKMAFLKYLSENIGLYSRFEQQARQWLILFSHSGKIFSFFKVFAEFIPELSMLQEYEIIEYTTQKTSPVVLNYCFDSGQHGETEYKAEQMRRICPNVYSSQFKLFLGERLYYYISCGNELTEEQVLETKESSYPVSNISRYDIINNVINFMQNGDFVNTMKELEQYENFAFMNSELFKTL